MSESKVTHGQQCTCHLCKPSEAARILAQVARIERELPAVTTTARRIDSPAMVR